MSHNTRSQNPPIHDDLKNYFKSLIEPLVTNDSINIILKKFEDNIISKFEERLRVQEERITVLESTLALRQKTVDVLIEQIDEKCDTLEQYSRRDCIRIHGIEEGMMNNVDNVVEDCFKHCDVGFGKEAIDRAHVIGQPYLDEISNKRVQSIIVKFNTWNDRTAFYKARPKSFADGKKLPGTPPFRVSLDLTKHRFDLLRRARELIKDNPNFLYAFSNVNCSLLIKDKSNKNHNFNSEVQLNNILNGIK